MSLTKKRIESLEPRSRAYIAWDSLITGFGVIVYPSGRKSFCIQFRDHKRKSKKHVIGSCSVMQVDDARAEARRCLALATLGNTTFLRQDTATETLLSDVWARYEREHAQTLKISTRKENARLWLANISDVIGGRPVATLQKRDVADLHNRYFERPYLGNRILSLLSLLLGLSERWGLREEGTNPCSGIQRYCEKSRERVLTDRELEAIDRELTSGRYHQSVVLAIRLLFVTGCRLREILNMKWEFIDWDARLIRFPDSKTGAKTVDMNPSVQSLLADAHQLDGNPYVCWGSVRSQPRIQIHRPWKKICEACGIPDVRLHDIRHTFASTAISHGANLIEVRDLLGHSDVQTTQRYAHLETEARREASRKVSGVIRNAMQRQPTGTEGKVINLKINNHD